MKEFIVGFAFVGIATALIIMLALWLISLVISVLWFNWPFILIVSLIAGFIGGVRWNAELDT